MGDEHRVRGPSGEELQHLKRVSRIKHTILQKYLPPWAIILGSRHRQLVYFDCFAGPGEYELEGTPSFFLIDPYGHPLPIPVINSILRRRHTEALINLMWFRINMDLSNPLMQGHLDELFGNDAWRHQPFIRMRGVERERAVLEYFRSCLVCKFMLPFKVRYDIEDSHGGHRTKYYLLHVSNHVKAVLLMKEVMWPLGDEEGTFDFSGEAQGVLISSTPILEELESILLRQFKGKELGFDELRERTWSLPFIEKHYREVVRRLEGKDVVVHRITSKRKGLGGQDRIRFR
jgi:hypothetical protein